MQSPIENIEFEIMEILGSLWLARNNKEYNRLN